MHGKMVIGWSWYVLDLDLDLDRFQEAINMLLRNCSRFWSKGYQEKYQYKILISDSAKNINISEPQNIDPNQYGMLRVISQMMVMINRLVMPFSCNLPHMPPLAKPGERQGFQRQPEGQARPQPADPSAKAWPTVSMSPMWWHWPLGRRPPM